MSEEENFGTITDGLVASIRAAVPTPVLYDLGCGQNPQEGFTGLDYFAEGPTVKKSDLYSFPWRVDDWPIPAESVDYMRASHFVEHVPDWDGFFTEAWRVLKPGACFEIISPYWSSVRASQDPDHKQPISEQRFFYLNQEWLKKVGRNHYGLKVNFGVHRGIFFFSWNQDYIGKEDAAREFAKKHYLNVVDDIALVLEKLPIEEAA